MRKRNPTPGFTTIRLRSKYGDNGGEYCIDPSDLKGMERVRKDLKSAQDEEPNFGWHLETRGTHNGWHKWKENSSSNPPTCKLCGGPKMVLGSLGWTRHFRCRDCGAESSQKVRRPKPKKKNPTRRRASTKRILKAWMRAKSGKGAMALHRKAARRMGLKASMFIRKE